MKKIAALLLSLLCLMSAVAFAEDSAPTPEIEYEGTWKQVRDFGFQLYLPNDWVLFTDEPDFMAGTQDATRYFWVETYESEGYSVDDVLLEFSQLYPDAQLMAFSEARFATFSVAKADIYCGVTLSKDESKLYFFKFSPARDDAFISLAQQILSSYSLL